MMKHCDFCSFLGQHLVIHRISLVAITNTENNETTNEPVQSKKKNNSQGWLNVDTRINEHNKSEV